MARGTEMFDCKLTFTEVRGCRLVPGTLALVAALVPLLVAGCTSAPPKPEEPKLVWPAPPEPPRIQFVRSIMSEEDLKKDTTFTAAMASFLTGEKIPEGRIASLAGLAVSADGQRLYVADPM